MTLIQSQGQILHFQLIKTSNIAKFDVSKLCFSRNTGVDLFVVFGQMTFIGGQRQKIMTSFSNTSKKDKHLSLAKNIHLCLRFLLNFRHGHQFVAMVTGRTRYHSKVPFISNTSPMYQNKWSVDNEVAG